VLRMRAIGALFGALALGACAATLPTGPTVMALPAQGKSFVDFQQDDLDCRQYAAQQTGGVSPSEAASESLAGNAAIGTLLGAAAGAAIGAATGGAAAGAAIGAGSGLVLGGVTGAEAAGYSSASLQRRYDMLCSVHGREGRERAHDSHLGQPIRVRLRLSLLSLSLLSLLALRLSRLSLLLRTGLCRWRLLRFPWRPSSSPS